MLYTTIISFLIDYIDCVCACLLFEPSLSFSIKAEQKENLVRQIKSGLACWNETECMAFSGRCKSDRVKYKAGFPIDLPSK